MPRLLRFTLFVFLLTSCVRPAPSSVAPPTPNSPILQSPVSSSPVSNSPTPPPTESASLPRPQYTFFVTLDYRRKNLTIQEYIVYVNASGENLADLVLAVVPNLWNAVFTLDKLEVDGTPVSDYELDGQRLTIHLPDSLAPNGTVKLALDYQLLLPPIQAELSTSEIRPQFFGYTSRQMNLVNWYPFIVPRAAVTWLLHDPWFYGEHLVYDTADFEVNIKNAEEGIVPTIAASGPPEPNAEWTRYTLTAGRAFAFTASTEMKVSVTNAGNVFIFSYYFPLYAPAGKAAAEAAAQAINIFAEKFGPYPHKTLTIVQGDFNDGAEFSAFFFLSKGFYKSYDNTRQNYLIMISAHETAHQWWFEQVANDQYLEPWLDESLAIYSEHIFYETTDSPLVNWWWDYRVNSFHPQGFVDMPLNTSFEGDMYRGYVNAVYLRGAYFIQELRDRMGDEAFFAFLRDYLTQFNGQRASADDFFRILREHTDADISDLVTEYFQNPH